MTKNELYANLSSRSEDTILSIESLRSWLDIISSLLSTLTLIPDGSISKPYAYDDAVDVYDKAQLVCDGDLLQVILGNTFAGDLTLDKITRVGSYAFYNVYDSMSPSTRYSFNFPNVTEVDEYAFDRCLQLEELTLGSCLSIGARAFWMCYNLHSIYLPGDGIAELEDLSAFDHLPNDYIVYVNPVTYQEYLAAPVWSSIANHILPILNDLGIGTVVHNDMISVGFRGNDYPCVIINIGDQSFESSFGNKVTFTMPANSGHLNNLIIYIGNFTSVNDVYALYDTDQGHAIPSDVAIYHMYNVIKNSEDATLLSGTTYDIIYYGRPTEQTWIYKGGI